MEVAVDQRVRQRRRRAAVVCTECEGLVDPTGFAGDRVTEIIQHALEQHADHHFILYQKDTLSC